MKTLICGFVLLCIVGFAGAGNASSLSCDPQAGVTQHEIFVGGVSQGIIAAEADGSILWNVDHLAPGQYTFEAVAIDASGWGSDKSVPFDATKPGVVTNVRIVP